MTTDPIKADFRNCLALIWNYLGLPSPTPVQYDLAEYLQHGPRRRMVQGFRGIGKSWIASAYALWSLHKNPDKKIEVVSASKNLADNFSTFVLSLINGIPEFRYLRPRNDQREAKVQFDVGPARPSKDPSVKSVGITGQITGTRADIIIPDDIEVANNSQTPQMRDKLSEQVKEFDAVLKPDGEVLYLGTPQTEQSLYNQLAQRGYDIRIYPARYPSKSQISMYQGRLAPFIETKSNTSTEGKSTDPMRFSDIDLMERELSYGRSGFALQFMLDTSLSDANRYPLKLSDMIVLPLDPDIAPEKLGWASSPDLVISDLTPVGFNGDRYYRPMFKAEQCVPYTGCVMAIDPSGRGSDETGYAIVKFLNGYLFLVASGGLSGGYKDENLDRLAQLAKTHKVNKVIVEPNFGDGSFAQLLRPVMNKIYPVTIEDTERSSAQKEQRIIDCLEPVLNRHKLVVDAKVIREDQQSVSHLPAEQGQRYQLMYQLTRLTKDRRALAHDDRLDALALAVHYWISRLARDADQAIDDRKQSELDDALDLFLEECDIRVPRKAFSVVQWT